MHRAMSMRVKTVTARRKFPVHNFRRRFLGRVVDFLSLSRIEARPETIKIV